MRLLAPLLLSALALSNVTHAQQASSPTCSIRPVSFQGWEAQEVVNRWLKLTFIPKLGGRLMQVEFNGHPYLFINPKYRGQYISPQQAAGEWINYGGDKIWPMPEGNSDEHHWVLASTAIDDLPYEFKILSQDKRCAVQLTGQPDTITGLQYIRTIAITADSPAIQFHAVMKNATAHPIEWSVQSVSQYDLNHPDQPSDYNHRLWAYTPVNPASSYPDGFHVRSGLADDPSFSVADNLFHLHWMYFDNEVWLDSTAGWLAVVDQQSRYGMVEQFTFKPHANYPGKATVIFYKNGPSVSFDHQGQATIRATTPESTPYYMEAEINSPIVNLAPGETYAMDTTWNPIRIDAVPQSVTGAGVVTQRLRATRHGNSITLTGAFSPFEAGSLTALLLDNRHKEIARRVLHQVLPEENITLNDSLPAAPNVTEITLKLDKLDAAHGADHNTLDTAHVETSGSISR